ncbi:molybdopterin-synthase adenylyltransferase MoeB [Aliidiomarina sedimenti]|uniref:Molybdopterin-synthase adenylyltransferase MoeB n=1 Tax=Aliidiomarina sedimenti TaxID=1933879 RepID=A0ABY0BXS1_9GAMM|nr:HesA/MoeB/ThiF family protein [Aliidiomarina sedimenti]RUO29270.1 molybdopterin-synthase adenylyltransferase MoeB [Aliidiomarina sedimenti]
MLSDADFLRYSRQLMLPLCGESGIQRLRQARVALVGLGGLGSLVAPYLAAAGVGTLRLFDHDSISLSNLPRQWLYQETDVQMPKVAVMARQLKTIHAGLKVDATAARVSADNIHHLLSDIDLIIDCSDNMATRQLLNRHAFIAEVPLVTGAAIGMQAQGMAFHSAHCGTEYNAGCYHCLYPITELAAGSCQTDGVLGPVVGMAGCYQATLALRILLQDPAMQWSQLWRFDLASGHQQIIQITQDTACPVCAGHTSAFS